MNTAVHAVLALLFGLTVCVAIERVIVLRRHRNHVEADGAALEAFLRARNWAGALLYFRARESVAAQLVAIALAQGAAPAASAKLLMRERLERGLTLLATLGNNAPFVGLLGTVIGIVGAFGALGQGAQANALMGAISEALIATAVGLVVALPAVVAYNHLQRRVETLLAEADALCGLVLAEVPGGIKRVA